MKTNFDFPMLKILVGMVPTDRIIQKISIGESLIDRLTDEPMIQMLSKAKSRFIGKLMDSINQQNLECREIKNSFELEY